MIGLAEIEGARERIEGRVRHTELRASPGLSDRLGVPVFNKMEHRQTTGSFKLRGATNAILELSAAAKERGVVTASTGNHGRAIAHAAKEEGIRGVVCLSELVPANKIEAIEALGAEVRVVGRSQDEADEEVERLARDEGLTRVSAFDDAAVIAGQGTLGLEIVDDLPDAGTVVVPLSGGGLIAGIAAAVKGKLPSARIVGVSMERGAAMYESLRAGKPVLVEEQPSLADSLGGGIGLANSHTFRMCRELVDDVVLLSEAEIAAAIRYAYETEQEILEGAAAVPIGAILAGKLHPAGPTVLVLSGRNIDMAQHRRIVGGADRLE